MTPRPTKNTSSGRRALALIRVSKERDDMTSPEVQRHAIDTLAKQHGITIVDYVEGIDESGSRARSAWWPRLDQSIERMAAGEIDDILVWKFSRVGRQRLRWAIALDRVDTLGGSIISATEPIESATASGRFARGMLGEVNAYQADLIGETWKEAHDRRVRAGLPANGKPRMGYAYSADTKTFAPDPISGPILRDAYLRYIAGESIYSLVKWLNDGPTQPSAGYSADSDGLWSARTLRRVMDSGFAAGYISSHGELLPGAHESLLTTAEWDAYLEARERRRVYRRTERSEYVLSGMVWCSCGAKMHAGMFGHSRTPKFRCAAAVQKRAHTGGYVTEKVLLDAVDKWLHEREARLTAESADAVLRLPKRKPIADPRPELERRLARAEDRQDRLAEQRIEAGIPQATYERLRDKYAAERAAIETELRALRVRDVTPVRMPADILAVWADLEIPEKRALLRRVIARIIVTPGHPIAHVEILGADG